MLREACLDDHPEAETAMEKQGEARQDAEGPRWVRGTVQVSYASYSPRITAPMNKLVTTRSSQNSL